MDYEENKNQNLPDASEYEDPIIPFDEETIRRFLDFAMPESKQELQDALWAILGPMGVHMILANITAPNKHRIVQAYCHASIQALMLDSEVRAIMTPSDYVQAHMVANNLASRAVSYEGDRTRDRSLFNTNIQRIEQHQPEPPKQTGFFSFAKK